MNNLLNHDQLFHMKYIFLHFIRILDNNNISIDKNIKNSVKMDYLFPEISSVLDFEYNKKHISE